MKLHRYISIVCERQSSLKKLRGLTSFCIFYTLRERFMILYIDVNTIKMSTKSLVIISIFVIVRHRLHMIHGILKVIGTTLDKGNIF